MMFKIFLFFISVFPLCADFNWNGHNYNRNSLSQQTAAFELLKEIQFNGDEIILDVGCGDGKITKEIASRVPNGKVIGIDPSKSQINFAKRLETPSLSFVVEDVLTLPYIQKFDVVASFTALQWVEDQNTAYKNIYRSLKPNGKMIVTVPMGITWQLSEAVRDVICLKQWQPYAFRDKQHFFLREQYAAHLRSAGFVIDSFKLLPSYNLFPDRATFTAFVKQWLPFVQDVPVHLQDEFMRQVIDHYLKLVPLQNSGEVFFEKYVYNIVAHRRVRE